MPKITQITDWKEEFDKQFGDRYNNVEGNYKIIQTGTELVCIYDFIQNLLDQQKKELITELLSEAPEDREYSKEYTCICDYGKPCENCIFGLFNLSNNEWRTLLESKLK